MKKPERNRPVIYRRLTKNTGAGLPIEGAVLSDQVKSLDWKARDAELICTLPNETITGVLEKLAVLVTK